MDFNNLKEVNQRELFYILNAFPEAYLKSIISLTKSISKPFQDNGHSNQIYVSNKERTCWEIPKTELTEKWMKEVSEIVNKANKLYQFELFEILSVYYFEYTSKDITSLDWHIDIGKQFPQNTRKISFSIMVNDAFEYEGGDLEFAFAPNNILFPKVKGSIVCFPSFLPHRVTPVTKGIRKSIVGFVGGRPFR